MPNRPFTPAIAHATFKHTPHDFIVKEIMDIEYTHDGEHLWLYVCKVGMNTAFVAKLLADWAGMGVRDVGYSGLKDRHAETYQWFSLRIPHRQMPDTDFHKFIKPHLQEHESLTILAQYWHNKKLNRGTHKFNEFTITLKQVSGDKTAIDEQLQSIQTTGVPNYFGEQRFGIDGNNIDKTKLFFEKLLASNKPYKPFKKELDKHSIYISTAKSVIFNALLSKRVALGNWDKAVAGDVFNLDGTGSIFTSAIDGEIIQRINDKDIHPTAPLFGVGEMRNADESLAIYDNMLNQEVFNIFKQGLLKVNTKLSYRPLRLCVHELDWHWQDDDLALKFVLPSGAFATSVLFAICEDLQETSFAKT